MGLNLQNFFKRSQARDGSPRYILTLNVPVFALAVTIMVIMIGWSFYMGLVVGRGQNPEKHLEEIAGILQSTRESRAPAEAKAPDKPAPSPEEQAPSANATLPPDAQPNGILAQTAQPVPPAPAKPAQEKEAKAPEKPKPAPPPAPEAKPAGEPRYAYTFQLAALRSQADANRVVQQCAKKGLRLSVQQSGKVWLVKTSLRGTEKDVANLKSQVKAARLGAPLLLSKKEIK